MISSPRNLMSALERLDSAARTVTQAGHELRSAHVAIGNVPDLTARMLDLYIELDRLHDRIRDVMADTRARAAAR